MVKLHLFEAELFAKGKACAAAPIGISPQDRRFIGVQGFLARYGALRTNSAAILIVIELLLGKVEQLTMHI